jgi:signal transduction histidine kinase
MSKRYLHDGDTTAALESTAQVERLSMILYGLCDSLYYLSLTDQNKLIKSKRLFDLRQNALDPVLDELNQELKKKNMKLKVDSSGQGMLFLGEDRLFRIAFRNIIKNAILFSDEGKQLAIGIKQSGQGITITLKNHGPDFTPEELDSLFDRYVTVNPRVRKNPGYNLYLVRRIVEVHGGTIRAEKGRGGWMHFTINLPKIE